MSQFSHVMNDEEQRWKPVYRLAGAGSGEIYSLPVELARGAQS